MTTLSKAQSSTFVAARWLWILLVMALVLGISLRFYHIDHKIYWHDEVFSSLRAAGFTSHEIDQQLYQNHFLSPTAVQQFQQLKPNSTPADTIHSLILEDPQHPPLYFVMQRFWMQMFGSSIFASRLLAVLLSVLGLPLMYGLAMELFNSRLASLLATVLLALSPFDMLFAQTARQYGLLTAMTIGSSWFLLRAMRKTTWQAWSLYGLSLAIGLYTHAFFALTLVAQAVYVLGLSLFPSSSFAGNRQLDTAKPTAVHKLTSGLRDRRLWQFAAAVLGALVLYSPWIWVLLGGYQRATSVTSWAEGSYSLLYRLQFWILSFTALFVDIDFGFNNPATYLLRLPFVLLILAALYFVYRRTSVSTWLFIFTSILIPFLILALPDLLSGGRRSTVSRYLIPCYPGVQLAVAYFLGLKLATGKSLWRWVLSISLIASIISCGMSAAAESWWHQVPSYQNPEVLHLLNREAGRTSPVLLADTGDDFTNTGDLISLSYGLSPDVRLFLVNATPDLKPIANESEIYVFRPSKTLKAAIAQQGWQLTTALEEARLGRIQK
jgi:uncharacterized membrane protein